MTACAECPAEATQARFLVDLGLLVGLGLAEDESAREVPLCDLHALLVQCDIDDDAADALYRLPSKGAFESSVGV